MRGGSPEGVEDANSTAFPQSRSATGGGSNGAAGIGTNSYDRVSGSFLAPHFARPKFMPQVA